MDRWFEEDFGGPRAVRNLLTVSPGDGARLRPSDLARSLPDLLLAVDSLLPSRRVGVDLGHLQWADLARDTKIGFREAWEGEFGTDPSRWPQYSSGSQTHASPDHYQAADELNVKGKAKATGALSLSGGPEFGKTPAVPDSGLSVPRWVWVGGGLGVLGLVLAAGFFVFGGSDDPDSVAGTGPVAVVEDEPAVAVEEGASSGVGDGPDAGVADPFDLLTVTEASLLADPRPGSTHRPPNANLGRHSDSPA